ncbi:hypothetical protein ABPG72_015603 [Tetrahymena utriculariae]
MIKILNYIDKKRKQISILSHKMEIITKKYNINNQILMILMILMNNKEVVPNKVNSPFLENKIEIEEKYGETNNYTKEEEEQEQQDEENQQQNINSHFFFQETEFAGNYNVETNNQSQNLEQYQRFYTQQNYTKQEEGQVQQDDENQQQNMNSYFFFQETEFAGNYNVETNNQAQNLEQYQRFYTQQNYTKQEEGQVQQDDENQQQNINSHFFFQETEFAGNYNVETNNQAQNLEQYQRFYTQQNYTKQEEGQVQQDDENQQQNINSHFFFQETEFAGNYNVENNNFILIPQQLNEDNSSITLNQYNLSNNNGQLQKRQINLNGKIKNYLEKNNQLQIQNLSPQNQIMLRHLLRDYIESLNPINQKPETQFMCFCSLQYQNKRSLQKHLNNIHRFLPYLWLWHYQFDETQLGQII